MTKRFRQLRGYRYLALYLWRRTTQEAIDDVSQEICQGELFGLLGEKGAGRTTLIRMLSTTLVRRQDRPTTSSFGIATTRRAPQARGVAPAAPAISSRRFQGMIRITSGRTSARCSGAKMGMCVPGVNRPCL